MLIENKLLFINKALSMSIMIHLIIGFHGDECLLNIPPLQQEKWLLGKRSALNLNVQGFTRKNSDKVTRHVYRQDQVLTSIARLSFTNLE